MEKPDIPENPTRYTLPLAKLELILAIIMAVTFSFLYYNYRPFCMIMTVITLVHLASSLGLFNYKAWAFYLGLSALPLSILGVVLILPDTFHWWYLLLPGIEVPLVPLVLRAKKELISEP